jgi:hypothetical protein
MAQPMGPQEYTEPIERAFEDMREGIDKAVEKFNGLVDKVKQWAWMLGAATIYWIKNNLDTAREALELLMEKAKYATQHQVPVTSLILTSFVWVHQVKTPVSDLSFQSTEPADEELAKWTGDAAFSYLQKAGKQRAAIDETVIKAEFVSQWLFNIAKANVDYAVELAHVITAFAGHCMDAFVEAAGVVTIPWAVDTLGDAAGMLLESGLNNLISIGQRFIDALGNVRDLGTQVGDHSRLPGGNWPEAVRG